jgi:hypothetical protein
LSRLLVAAMEISGGAGEKLKFGKQKAEMENFGQLGGLNP